MIIRNIFSERFLLLKQAYHLSYTDFAEMLGVKSKNTVNDWVRSQKGFPNETMLVLISNIFAVSLDWLLGRIERPYNEILLDELEEEYAIPIFKEGRMPESVPYFDDRTRRNYYSYGQRANLIFAAVSSFHKMIFKIYTLKQIEEGNTELKSMEDFLKASNTLNDYIADIKYIGPLLRGELDKPVFDLEAAIKEDAGIQAQNSYSDPPFYEP